MKLKKNILFLMAGPQGSGKGTQSALLADRLGLPHFVAGDCFRLVQKENSEVGKRVRDILGNGHLMTIDLWEQVVGRKLRDLKESSIILDGVLRSAEQIEAFEKIQVQKEWPPVLVINLNLPRQISIERLSRRGRHDDTPKQIEARLAWSENEIKPVLTHFRAKGQVIDVEADQPIQDVEAEIISKLKDLDLVADE
ncbi:nucleoside monophosphate kinase [Candidatus Berkelbacteria bacterium]|nr:nucleoside monophosphate kinase [Candidatus Berkelbacteria bacterium]